MTALRWYLPLQALAILVAQQALRFSLAHAALAFVVTASVTVLLVALPDIHEPRWPRQTYHRPDGTRDRITALSWAFTNSENATSDRGIRAVRHAATVRLALHGVDLTDPDHAPAARALLGDATYTQLTPGAPAPTMTQIARCIDRIADRKSVV